MYFELVTLLLTMAITTSYCEHYGRVVYTAKKQNYSWVHRKPVIYVKTQSWNKKIRVGERQYMLKPSEYTTDKDMLIGAKEARPRNNRRKSKKRNRRKVKILRKNRNSTIGEEQKTESTTVQVSLESKLESSTVPVISELPQLPGGDYLSDPKPDNSSKTNSTQMSETESLTDTAGIAETVFLIETEPEADLDIDPEDTQVNDASYVNTVTPTNNDDFVLPSADIKFYFDKHSYDDLILKKVDKAMKEIQNSTCLRFQSLTEKPTDESGLWLHITNPNRDRSCRHGTVKRDSGEMIVVLGLDCLRQEDILHTLMHAIGVRDEISHPSRDQYVRVLFNNIKPEHRELFRVDQSSQASLVEFDPMSVMQFKERAFSKNGRPTVASLLPGMFIIPSEHLSHLDKLKLKVRFAEVCKTKKLNHRSGCNGRSSTIKP